MSENSSVRTGQSHVPNSRGHGAASRRSRRKRTAFTSWSSSPSLGECRSDVAALRPSHRGWLDKVRARHTSATAKAHRRSTSSPECREGQEGGAARVGGARLGEPVHRPVEGVGEQLPPQGALCAATAETNERNRAPTNDSTAAAASRGSARYPPTRPAPCATIVLQRHAHECAADVVGRLRRHRAEQPRQELQSVGRTIAASANAAATSSP